jgi:uncharacterized protein (TIGR02265 family)
VDPTDRAIELVAPYCDIVERLALVPPSAQLRGLWIKNIERQVAEHGQMSVYREYFPNDRYGQLPWYPISEFLVRLACSGALVTEPKRVHEGMFIVNKGNAGAFINSLLGRVMLRVLSHDPVRLLEQGLAARRQSFSYGRWELVRLGDRAIEVTHRDEYWWIESGVAGAARGTFEACGIEAEIETKLLDRFNGSTICRW